MLINTISYFFALDIIYFPAQNVLEHFEIHSAYFGECLWVLHKSLQCYDMSHATLYLL